MADDKVLVEETIERLKAVRDNAHWLSVHRRYKLAKHLEELAEVQLDIARELQGKVARREREKV